METRQAACLAGQAAQILTLALEKQSNDPGSLVQGLAVVVERMEPRERAQVLRKAADIVTLALMKRSDDRVDLALLSPA